MTGVGFHKTHRNDSGASQLGENKTTLTCIGENATRGSRVFCTLKIRAEGMHAVKAIVGCDGIFFAADAYSGKKSKCLLV